MPRVLFVDDEERILRSLRMLFRGRCEILTTTSGHEAIEWVRQRPVHVVVSDQRMPEIGGVEVLRAVAGHSPATMRILLTGYADMDAVTASVNDGEIYRFIEKPWDALRLIDTVEQAARIAQDGFAAPPPEASSRKPSLSTVAARVLVLDDDGAVAAQVRELMPEAVRIEHATSLPDALDAMAVSEIAVVVAQLSSAAGDVAEALKQLKRLCPGTLVIVVSPLRDSRLVIGLINEGQIFRFLLQPPPRELLRRGLLAALQRHAELRADAGLLRRHAVEPSRGDASTTPGWLQQAWRRIREATALRIG
ncbi:response regulator [Dokdonella sp.]|uniref:response regulator n=1 Tax=Dokdonella sp. TaxID=2291710 RepID=UPI00262CBC27|nr:response regulator [Dokdonella sp.]